MKLKRYHVLLGALLTSSSSVGRFRTPGRAMCANSGTSSSGRMCWYAMRSSKPMIWNLDHRNNVVPHLCRRNFWMGTCPQRSRDSKRR